MQRARTGGEPLRLARADAGRRRRERRRPEPPQNIRVTDLPSDPPTSHPYPASKTFKGLRVAWDPQGPAPARYELYRSTDPVFPNGGTKIKGTFVECVSPQAPTPGEPRATTAGPLLHGHARQLRHDLLLPRRLAS